MTNKPSFDTIEESNPSKPSLVEQTRSTNEAGGVSFNPFTPEFGLYKVTINQLLEDSYYDSADESFDKVWNRFTEVADENPEFVLQLAAYARQEQGFRDIAQLLLVLSANDERTQPYVRDYAPAIIDRTDEFNSVVSYQLRGYGKPIPKPLKKGITDALHKKYAIVKVHGPTFEDNPTARVTYIDDRSTETPRSAIDRGMCRVYEQNDVNLHIEQYGTEVVDEGYVHDEYTVSKYAQRNKEVSLHDVINLVRPNPRSDNRDDLFGRIVKGELDDNSVEALREDRTWEAERSSDTTQFTFDMSSIELGSDASNGPVTIVVDEYADLTATVQGDGEYVSHEYDSDSDTLTVDVKLTERQEWLHRLDDMGLMARVRNLRNMLEAGLDGSEIFDYDEGGFGKNSESIVQNSKMFPFRFYQAYKACGDTGGTSRYLSNGATTFDIDSDIMDSFTENWLHDAIDASTSNLPESLDNTFTAIDLSGSMDSLLSEHSDMTRAEIGVLFGSMLMKRGSDVGAFGSDFALLDVNDASRKNIPTLSVAKKIYSVSDSVGNSTNGWKALKWAIDENAVYDRFVVFTDEQLWDSTGFRSSRSIKDLWDQYVDEVNEDAHLYIIDTASYGDLAMPEGYSQVHQVSGWNDSVIEFIDSFEQSDDVVSEIESISASDY